MKNVINYYYNLNIDNIRMIDDDYYFLYHDKNFIFQKIVEEVIDFEAVYELDKFLSENNNFHYEIILNKNNSIITVVGNIKYVLMISNIVLDRNVDFYEIVESNVLVPTNLKSFDRLNRFNWTSLWIKKIDYFEFFISRNVNSYLLLNKYTNYFVGLGENAILYMSNTVKESRPNTTDNLVVSHKRIKDDFTIKNLYNPLNLVIDHPVRDLSEYLKKLFLSGKYKKHNISLYIDESNLSEFGARILIARMLFPSFFFDKFEDLIEGKCSERDMLFIVDKMNDYELFIQNIYIYLRSKFNIPHIDWLKKADYSSTLTTSLTSGISSTSIDSIPSFNVTSIMLQ